MASIALFLPPHLVQALYESGPPQRLPHVERFPAALLFSDISGFTALCEKLQARGREGAEEIATAINAAFAPAIRAIEEHGGSIVSFGGDALFSLFTGEGPVRRARSAATDIRDAFAATLELSTTAGSVPLRISQGIHFATVEALHLGTEGRRCYLVGGKGVHDLLSGERDAIAGQVRLTHAAERELRREPEAAPAARPGCDKHWQGGGGQAPALQSYLPRGLPSLVDGFEGVYRRATVLFLETKGHAPRAMQTFFLSLCEAIDRYDGLLLKADASCAGTTWLCALGVASTHEDDPDRGARLALELRDRLPPGLALRGGVAEGTLVNVIIGTERRRSFDVMGDVVNTAARVRGEAVWGELLATEGFARRLHGVRTEGRGAPLLKGKETSVALHALLRMLDRGGRRQIHVSAALVGRKREADILREALEQAAGGKLSVIGIEGAAGIGKSRLKWEAARMARAKGFEVHEGRAVTFAGMSYWATCELLRGTLQIELSSGRDEVLARVAAAASDLRLDATDRHHLAEVLGFRYDGSPIRHLDGPSVRLNNCIAIRNYLRSLARARPRLYVLEDMHWSDDMTREAVTFLAKGQDTPALLLLLYRTGYEPPPQAHAIQLSELSDDDVAAMLRSLLSDASPPLLHLVRERAGGNPLYIEEVVRHLLESGVLGFSDQGYVLLRPLSPEDVPETIEALIATRLDRLPAGTKSMAQCASVIGRSFLYDLLERLPDASGHAAEAVAQLRDGELIFEKARHPHLEYIWKHALTRDVAYASILAVTRRRLHRAVADGIEELWPAERDAFLGMLGHHREQAGQKEEARVCYLAGARASVKRYAHGEAEQLFRSYLALVQEESVESAKARTELGAEMQLQGRLKQAEGEYQVALHSARSLGDRSLEATTLRVLGNLQREQGRMGEARAQSEQALTVFRELGDRRGEGVALSNLGKLEAYQGRVEAARARYEQSLAISREVGDRRGEGIALGSLAVLHLEHGWIQGARAHYEEALAIHRDVGDRRNEGIALGNLGALHYTQGQIEEARVRIEQALAVSREVGDRQTEGHALGNLGSLCLQQGRMDEARAHREQALAVSREVGDRRGEGIALMRLGSLRVDQGRMEEAREHHEQALAIAREVGDLRGEANVLGNLAGLEILASTDVVRADNLAREAETAFLAVGDRGALCQLLSIRGHIALAGGGSPAKLLDEARRIAAELGVGPESEIARDAATLERAQAAAEARRPLVCGHCAEDLTPGQLRWLRAHRPEAIPPEVMARLDEDGRLGAARITGRFGQGC